MTNFTDLSMYIKAGDQIEVVNDGFDIYMYTKMKLKTMKITWQIQMHKIIKSRNNSQS